MNRRQALKTGALLAGGALLAPRLPARTATSKLKVGACDWSLRQKQQLEAFRLGKQLGLDGIQFTFGNPDEGIDLRRKAGREALRSIVAQTGIEVASLGIGLLNQIPFASTQEGEQLAIDCIAAMDALKKEARQLGDPTLAAKVSPGIVLLAFFSAGDINGQPELIQKTIQKLKRIAPSAEKAGVTLGIETWLNEADHRHILDSVASPAVKIYYDVANSHKMGYDIYSEIKSLGKERICQIHCKEVGSLLGQGAVDFPRVKECLEAIRYDNWLVIESAIPKGMDLEKAYRHNKDYLQSVF